MNHTLISEHCHIIYAGGTFGSHGTPLAPLACDDFLPLLKNQLSQTLWHSQFTILPNTLIKDSSSLTPADFVHFYQLILHSYAQGARKFILITGTDSLSFLAAFLYHAFEDVADLSLVITGSMQPLLHPDNPTLTINDDSDAWANLSGSVAVASSEQTGVFVHFANQTFLANDTLKLDSQSPNAFIGKPLTQSAKPKPSHGDASSAILDRLQRLDAMAQKSKHINIHSIYCLPNPSTHITTQLQHIKHDKNACGVLIIAFGAGNLPYDASLADELGKLSQTMPVVCVSMCAYGGTNSNYAAGAWQYQYGVSPSDVGLCGAYGKLLWQALNI